MEPRAYVLTDADRALIVAARSAFRTDFRYAEAMLTRARLRGSTPAPEPEPPAVLVERRLEALDPRLCGYVAVDRAGCWVWTGGTSPSGPALRLGPERKMQPVRRWLYGQTREPVPAGRQVRAGDDCARLCVNPDHAAVLPPGVRKRRDLTRGRKA